MTEQTIEDLAELLEDTTCALDAFARLCAGCVQDPPVYLPNAA